MEIITENYNYESGDRVAGVLKVHSTWDFKPAEVELNLVGVAEVKWTDIAPLPFQETYNCKDILRLTYDQVKQMSSTSDTQEIEFEFKLPETDLPASFDGPYGSIKYNVLAMVRTADKLEHTVSHELKVHAPIRTGLNLTIGNSVEKDFGLLSLASGRIIAYASLARKGYAAGQVIELHCNVYNQSSVEATPRVTLYQTQVYMCGDRHKASQSALKEPIVGHKVDKQSNSEQILSVRLPDDACLSIKSEIIAVKYFLHVTLDIPHAFDVHVNLPFVVTTRSALIEPVEDQ